MNETFNIRRYWAAVVLILALGAGVVIGSLASRGPRTARILPEARPLAMASPASLSSTFAEIATRVTPAVVNINTESTIRFRDGASGKPDSNPNGFFNHFFGMGPGSIPHEMHQQSLGSGVILDKSGYVLTNYHVIMQDDGRPVDMIRVHLQGDDDGNPHGYQAKVVGYDKWTDLAVIKINAHRSLPVVELGDSDQTRVGDWVLAIGSPFGLNATVTAGIISAKGREINSSLEDEFKRFLQTDAAINPGNSGGPLVSLAGQVVGINTAIATTRGAYDGVGFAIPSKIVRKVYDDIVTSGSVRRGAIGVSFSPEQTPALLESFNAKHGVLVQSVTAGSPAARAGLKQGDVITTIKSQAIESGSELLGIVSGTQPGQKLRVEFLRDGHPMNCEVMAGDWNKIAGENDMPGPAAAPEGGPDTEHGSLGLWVKDLSADQAKQITASLHLGQAVGVMVEDVEPGSFADDLNLQRFDVILSINRQDVHSTADFKRIQSKLKSGQNVLVMIARRSEAGYTTTFLADQLP
ncbi:MAG TPA: Do family serine endopeptidase [Terriglobia bacterium]|nr:Do family serine endopeptidase [Terriglobia bacterium]